MVFAPRSLRARLSFALLLPLVVALVALGGLSFYAARSTLEDELGARLTDSAAVAASLLPAGLVSRFDPQNERTLKNLKTRLETVRKGIDARRVFLATLEGRSLVDTSVETQPKGDGERGLALDRTLALDQFELEQVGLGQALHSVMFTTDDGRRFMRGYAPLRDPDDANRVIAVVGVEGSARNYGGIDTLRAYLLGLSALTLGVMALLVFFFSRALTAPLRRLADAARTMAGGDLKAPVAILTGTYEVETLSRTMEEMRAALLARDRELQLMLGGIAHEVRNPLGGMKLFAGLLREDLAGRDEELKLLARVDTELGTLERVVEEFLTYARYSPVSRESVPLKSLLDEVGLLVLGLQTETSMPDDARAEADREQLKRVLLNLLRNARQAGAGRVVVDLDGDVIVLHDDGPGISLEASERIFDAFYTTREQGTGLGLALSRKIVAAHGGRLRLTNPGERGARFELWLPPR